MIILLIIGFGIIALVEVPELIRKKWWRELTGFGLFWLSGFVLCVIQALGYDLPKVSTAIGSFIDALFF